MGKIQSKSRWHRSRHTWRPWRSKFFLWSAACLLGIAMLVILRSSSPSALFPSASKTDIHATPKPFEHPQAVATASSPSLVHHSYSVIPGGVHSEKQLASVLARNPVVARHYEGFDLRKMRFVHLRHGREAYVSFRIGNSIFWTNRKVPLFAGETLVTDGTHYVRARCGNRISEIPRQPTLSWNPPALALSMPILHPNATLPTLAPLTGVGVQPLPVATGPGSPGGSPFFFMPPILLPPGGSGSPPDSPPNSPPGSPLTPGTPVQAPEPSTFVLLCSGLAVLGLGYILKMKGH